MIPIRRCSYPLIEAAETEHLEVLCAAAQLQAGLQDREQAYLLPSGAIGAGFNGRGRLLSDDAFSSHRSEDLFKSLARKALARGYSDLLERSNREEVQKSSEILKASAL